MLGGTHHGCVSATEPRESRSPREAGRTSAPGAVTGDLSGKGSRSLRSLPDYWPVPRAALGPDLNDQGYYVGRVARNLYWVTDGVYQAAFITTSDGVVLFDAPPAIGPNLQRAVDEIALPNGVTNRVTHLILSHHHADHVGASSLFDKNVVRIGHEETRRLLLRDDDPARPAPEETFQSHRTLEIGGERIDLAWYGSNHSPDNIYIHLPDHDAFMLVDVVVCGWAPGSVSDLVEDLPGYLEAPANALAHPWKHFIGGHMGRLGTRDDVSMHHQYMADIATNVADAIAKVDPRLYFQRYDDNVSAAFREYHDAVSDVAAAPIKEKYRDALGAVDVTAARTALRFMESILVDLSRARNP
jgi:glyoxylase-like metal-dependent hydrolase (beta-lactamase superfamily II)